MSIEMIPPLVQEQADEIRQHTGLDVEVTCVRFRKWRLALITDRVEMIINYTVTLHGYCRFDNSTLTIDGVARPLARSARHLAEIVRNLDANDELPPLPTPVNYEDAPPLIKHQYQSFARALRDTDLPWSLILGRGDDGTWVIGLDKDSRTGMRMMFRGTTANRMRFRLLLVVDGIDRSNDCGDDIQAAVSILCGAGTPAEGTPSSTPPPTSPTSKGYSSVDVRRHSVIRN